MGEKRIQYRKLVQTIGFYALKGKVFFFSYSRIILFKLVTEHESMFNIINSYTQMVFYAAEDAVQTGIL